MKHRKQKKIRAMPSTRRGALVTGTALLLAAASWVLSDSDAPEVMGELTEAPVRAVTAEKGWMPGATTKPILLNFSVGERDAQRGLILHVQEGKGSLYQQFSEPQQRSSSHFWVSLEGEIEQYVSVLDQAWTQVAGNSSWASVETAGFAAQPLTEAQVDAVARIYAWGAAEHGWPDTIAESPEGSGLGTHLMGGHSWGGHACPGAERSAQRKEILRRARNI
ncbi:N-acetylmuramoyl-L-alanine amidase [Streptomyces sp. NPDC057011]|uniref:peptidoglycan recognition protein family protein n=1 Tax=unclassified Streptomyces TaxID=2593676 RepID=UPI00362D29AB